LNWALHIFTYDLAYEPSGWPWTPVRKWASGFGELGGKIDASSSDTNNELLFAFTWHLLLLISILYSLYIMNIPNILSILYILNILYMLYMLNEEKNLP
jgi:hypothetical protein